jgi:Tol biopolymer transport system component
MNSDGSQLHSVNPPDEPPFEAAWSPDETRIAFWEFGEWDHSPEIYVVAPDGSALTKLTAPGWDQSPAWRPKP